MTEIRIRVGGTHTAQQDLGALESWLRREPWFQEELDSGRVVVARRGSPGGEPEGAMGIGIDDLILILIGAAIQPGFDELYNKVRASVKAWADNRRRQAADGEHPEATVESGTDAEALERGSDPEPEAETPARGE